MSPIPLQFAIRQLDGKLLLAQMFTMTGLLGISLPYWPLGICGQSSIYTLLW